MANMQNEKTKIKEQAPDIRNRNWDEVSLGYTAEEALNEASRCLQCKTPLCVTGCPVNVKIPDFIRLITENNVEGAYNKIKETNSFPAICGRVCPQENQCEGNCVRAKKGESVGIGRLERFCADSMRGLDKTKAECEKKAHRVAVIGSGPSGLSCSASLAQKGYDVTLFEALHTPGGVLVYGIPEFRLPKAIVKDEIDNIVKMGVKIETNTVVGKTVSVDELFSEGFEAVFIGSGAGLPNFMGIEGEMANGVFSANEYLTRINLMKAYREDYITPIPESKRVAVIGGGNVAMDAARCAKRLGADVSIVYRRSEKEMPARAEEVHHAKEEGIEFYTLTAPKKINTDENGCAESLTCVKMELGEPDERGRRRPIEIAGSEFDMKFDTVIVAVGTSPNPLLRMTTPGLETNKRGCIVTEEDGVSTMRKAVYAGGDAVTGAATVILAMGAGKKAAEKIDEYFNK